MYSTSSLLSGFSSLDDGGRCVLPPLHTVILLPLRWRSHSQCHNREKRKGTARVFFCTAFAGNPKPTPLVCPTYYCRASKKTNNNCRSPFWVGAVGSCDSCPGENSPRTLDENCSAGAADGHKSHPLHWKKSLKSSFTPPLSTSSLLGGQKSREGEERETKLFSSCCPLSPPKGECPAGGRGPRYLCTREGDEIALLAPILSTKKRRGL